MSHNQSVKKQSRSDQWLTRLERYR